MKCAQICAHVFFVTLACLSFSACSDDPAAPVHTGPLETITAQFFLDGQPVDSLPPCIAADWIEGVTVTETAGASVLLVTVNTPGYDLDVFAPVCGSAAFYAASATATAFCDTSSVNFEVVDNDHLPFTSAVRWQSVSTLDHGCPGGQPVLRSADIQFYCQGAQWAVRLTRYAPIGRGAMCFAE